jgi:hypothetical protein
MALMVLAQVRAGFTGGAIGYDFGDVVKKETEIRQGANHLLAAIVQPIALGSLCAVIQQIVIAVLGASPFFISVLVNIIPILSFPLFLLAGSAASGTHNERVKKLETSKSRLSYVVPGNLSHRTLQFLSGIAKHATPLFHIAITVSAVALACLGSYMYAIALLVMLLYKAIDKIGWIPHKLSLFVEKYMPILGSVGILIGGTLFLQIVVLLSLISYVRPVMDFLQYKIEWLVRCFVHLEGPSLEEYEAPLIEKRDLSFEDIQKIVDGNDSEYEFNPAHCSKDPLGEITLPENRNFQQYLDLFDKIDWIQSPTLLRKLKDDDRFCDFLQQEYAKQFQGDRPEVDIQLEKVAQHRKNTKEAFAFHWLRGQMERFVLLLQGKNGVPLAGNRADLDSAIPDYARILAYLESNSLEAIDKEDLLLKIAVEGGYYCALAIKKTSDELMRSHLVPQMLSNGKLSLKNKYETLLKFRLANQRYLLIETYYNTLIAKSLEAVIGTRTTQDLHASDLFLIFLKLGFYKISSEERKKIGFIHGIGWLVYHQFRSAMQYQYLQSLPDVLDGERIELTNRAQFKSYLNQVLFAHLKKEERDALLSRFSQAEERGDTIQVRRFQRIALVAMGILRQRQTQLREPETIPLLVQFFNNLPNTSNSTQEQPRPIEGFSAP